MKKFFLASFFMAFCFPLIIVCEEKEPVEIMEEVLEQADDQELEELFHQIVSNIEPPPPPPSPEDLRFTFREKITFAWNLFKEHVKAHKLGYCVGGLATASSITLIIYFLYNRRHGQQENE